MKFEAFTVVGCLVGAALVAAGNMGAQSARQLARAPCPIQGLDLSSYDDASCQKTIAMKDRDRGSKPDLVRFAYGGIVPWLIGEDADSALAKALRLKAAEQVASLPPPDKGW